MDSLIKYIQGGDMNDLSQYLVQRIGPYAIFLAFAVLGALRKNHLN